MEQNTIVDFAGWYITNRDKTPYFIEHCFRDETALLCNLSACVVEFAKIYGYNPFIFKSSEVTEHIGKINSDLEQYKDVLGIIYTVLGNENYLLFLQQNYTLSAVDINKVKTQGRASIGDKQIVFSKKELLDALYQKGKENRNIFSHPAMQLIIAYYKIQSDKFGRTRQFKNYLQQKDYRSLIDDNQLTEQSKVIRFKLLNPKQIILHHQNKKYRISEITYIKFELQNTILYLKNGEEINLGKPQVKEHCNDNFDRFKITLKEPFDITYNRLKDRLPLLTKLNENINDFSFVYKNLENLIGDLIDNSILERNIKVKDIDIESLVEELNLIAENTSLQLWYKSEEFEVKNYLMYFIDFLENHIRRGDSKKSFSLSDYQPNPFKLRQHLLDYLVVFKNSVGYNPFEICGDKYAENLLKFNRKIKLFDRETFNQKECVVAKQLPDAEMIEKAYKLMFGRRFI